MTNTKHISDAINGLPEELTLDDRLEIARYLAFRKVRHIRDTVCKNRGAKKLLTRVMRTLR